MDNGIKPEASQKKRRINPDRLVVTPRSLELIKSWKDQVTTEVKGIKVSIADLLNWLVQKQAETLSPQEVQEIAAQFFDEVKFAEWIARELKAAKARGEIVTLADLIQSHKNPKVKRSSEKVKRRKDSKEGQHEAASSSSVNTLNE